MNLLGPFLHRNPKGRVAIIDKDELGGICLTRGCIPSKMLLYPAEVVNIIEHAPVLGIDTQINQIHFNTIMKRMRTHVDEEIENIRRSLETAEKIDYYSEPARFIAPYMLTVGDQTIQSKLIFLCTGSQPLIPPIENIDAVEYVTSATILHLTELPLSMAIVGGGYIAAEYGFFFSAMGCNVTIVGRNPQFLPDEEPEISAVVRRHLEHRLRILTNHEVTAVNKKDNSVVVIAHNRNTDTDVTVEAVTLLIATGRTSTTDVLAPEQGNIDVDKHGWIVVDDHLHTNQQGIWAMGDATGKHLFKHVANYEAEVVYHNALLGHDMSVDYTAVPHAVFTHPEVAGVGMREHEAIKTYGKDNVLIGFYRYEDTGKGIAIDAKDYFVKVIVFGKDYRILGAHIVGPWASILIQEIINLMNINDRTMHPMLRSMHIHPAMSEVVQRAFTNLMEVDVYHHHIKNVYGIDLES